MQRNSAVWPEETCNEGAFFCCCFLRTEFAQNPGPKWCYTHPLITVSQSVSTCFVGIPSDIILFPSERGDKISFFQYMNPLCSLSLQGLQTLRLKPGEETARQSASRFAISVGYLVHRFCFWYNTFFSAEPCSAFRSGQPGISFADAMTPVSDFFSLLLSLSLSLHFWVEARLQEVNQTEGLAAFLLRVFRTGRLGCGDQSARRTEPKCLCRAAGKVCAALRACLIVKEGGGRGKSFRRVDTVCNNCDTNLLKLCICVLVFSDRIKRITKVMYWTYK